MSKSRPTTSTALSLSVGTHVEVSVEEDGLLGSYYSAKIISKLRKNKFKIEYTTLLAENQNDRLIEIAEASSLRPVPPDIRVSSFNVMDKVDAYDLDGWWTGRVTGRKSELIYSVYFECSGDEYDYPISALRVHQDYVDGEWISSQTRVCCG